MMLKHINGKIRVGIAISIMTSVIGLSWSKSLLRSQLVYSSQHLLPTHLSRTLRGNTVWIYAIAIAPDGKTLATGSYDRKIEIWNLQTDKLVHIFKGHTDAVVSLSISPDGKTLASGSWDNRIKLWNLKNGKLDRTFSGHSDDVESVAISRDGKTLVSGSWDRTAKVWNITTGKVLRSFYHTNPVKAVAISPDRLCR
ncbi:WD40 repeat domain-containing protein [Tolypothrix bouteillei VB521301_2]|uniref:WD40 repeat domain-containing protein n=1 Tax=Tolypothrix bouteillei TaxID=1246981 RepID=UPI0038B56B20